MRNIIWGFGLLSGLVNLAYLVVLGLNKDTHDFANGFLYGYAAMAVSLSFVFLGVFKAKQKHISQPFTFGKAFLTGLWISLISSCMYALGWLLVNKWMYPNFMNDYVNYEISLMKSTGKSSEELDVFAQQMIEYSEMYQNPAFAFLISISEILPVGFVFSVFSGLLFRKDIK